MIYIEASSLKDVSGDKSSIFFNTSPFHKDTFQLFTFQTNKHLTLRGQLK